MVSVIIITEIQQEVYVFFFLLLRKCEEALGVRKHYNGFSKQMIAFFFSSTPDSKHLVTGRADLVVQSERKFLCEKKNKKPGH